MANYGGFLRLFLALFFSFLMCVCLVDAECCEDVDPRSICKFERFSVTISTALTFEMKQLITKCFLYLEVWHSLILILTHVGPNITEFQIYWRTVLLLWLKLMQSWERFMFSSRSRIFSSGIIMGLKLSTYRWLFWLGEEREIRVKIQEDEQDIANDYSRWVSNSDQRVLITPACEVLEWQIPSSKNLEFKKFTSPLYRIRRD